MSEIIAAPILTGALFDFLGFLTTRAEPITLGASCNAVPAVRLLEHWAESRGLDLSEANVQHWRDLLSRDPDGEVQRLRDEAESDDALRAQLALATPANGAAVDANGLLGELAHLLTLMYDRFAVDGDLGKAIEDALVKAAAVVASWQTR